MKFISSVLLPVLFILLSEALAQEYIDYRLAIPEETETYGRRVVRAVNSKCSKPGPICNDCKNIHFCDGQNSSSLLWTCSENETCDQGQCTTTATPQCSPLASTAFICNNEGVFPDPADCFKYHYCILTPTGTSQGTKLIDYPRACKNDSTNFYSYNAKSSYCDVQLANEVCARPPVPFCNTPAQTEPLTSNPSIYYICKMYSPGKPNSKIILYPYLYICENGKNYNGDYRCDGPAPNPGPSPSNKKENNM